MRRCPAAWRGFLAEDPLLSAFGLFTGPAQERERYFLKNSVSGFLGWLAAQKDRAASHPKNPS